jgi:hypothetical protein
MERIYSYHMYVPIFRTKESNKELKQIDRYYNIRLSKIHNKGDRLIVEPQHVNALKTLVRYYLSRAIDL